MLFKSHIKVEVHWLYSVPVAELLCCLEPQCAKGGSYNSGVQLSDMPLCPF